MPSCCSEMQTSAVAVVGVIFVVEIKQKQEICFRFLFHIHMPGDLNRPEGQELVLCPKQNLFRRRERSLP